MNIFFNYEKCVMESVQAVFIAEIDNYIYHMVYDRMEGKLYKIYYTLR